MQNNTITRARKIELSVEVFRSLRDHIYEQSGIFFPENKLYLIESRLNRRIRELNLDSFNSYVRYLRDPEHRESELTKIYNLITINETYFFRYEKQLEAFAVRLLPELMERRQQIDKKRITIWSAASSSGEEVYTLAMILKEKIEKFDDWQITLIGTDISEKSLNDAEAGSYGKNSFRGSMKSYYKIKYFNRENDQFNIKDELKKIVEFKFLNLNEIDSIHKMQGVDFLFCRNVLIYFDREVKRRVVKGFYDVLNPGGYLFLGEAESLHGISSAFKVEHFPGAFVYKKVH